jgi:hypothetical protein
MRKSPSYLLVLLMIVTSALAQFADVRLMASRRKSEELPGKHHHYNQGKSRIP